MTSIPTQSAGTPPPQPVVAQNLPPTDPAGGLRSADAAQLLLRFGPNAIADHVVPVWRQLLVKFWAPVPWMLEAVIVLQIVLGRGLEALVIAVLLVFNAVVAFVQEQRAQDALALLRKQLHVRARVLRDGQWSRIPAEQVVPGDIVHIRAGDIVPADLLLQDGAVALDQAALTGESLPVDAGAGKPAYTGSIVRQGEATGAVTATGARTFFGHTAELVRSASSPSHMQRTIFAIVKRLVVFDAVLVALVVGFALWHQLPLLDTAVFALMLLVASVPVALPATYTLATAVSSQLLAHQGVLVTRLPAVEEAAAMDTLVCDKTGTLTQNSLSYAGAVPLVRTPEADSSRPMPPEEPEANAAAAGVLAANADDDALLRAAALASDDATQDPLDLALLAPARERNLLADAPTRSAFHPFDPSTRRSEGVYLVDGQPWHAVKGAATVIGPLCRLDVQQRAALDAAEHRLAANGARVLAIAAGPVDALQLLGVVGLTDPPRPDAAALIAQIRELGVRVCMATGDAEETARAIGAQLGIGTRVCQAEGLRGGNVAQNPENCDLYARVLPEDKHHIVVALQKAGHVTGMTGDGVNDAPALRQAEMGIAVASATDVAKAAAGVVLTDPGLGGVLTVVRAGREVHRRMLTYTLNKTLKVFEITVFLTLGLLLTGGFLVSPLLIVLMLFANDFVTMSIATDRVRLTPTPQHWDVRRLVAAAAGFASLSLVFSIAFYFIARSAWGLDGHQSQTLAFLILVFTNQAGIYALRTNTPLWSLAPSRWMAMASIGDLTIVSLLAGLGVLMAPLPWSLIVPLLASSVVFSVVLDAAKRPLFKHFAIA
ncbi:MAG: HAD-IC family P-type ATPase [Betaproteobacteria bacterium]|nr:HAD-IC family P-type ATPase [Betaproteobacteria bacterium]MDE2122402.1 HAD-IC family P-type ATPase [Betaproteobacteria bacterium]MDE2186254.1 HAD-IC family P-type ATPase [Betaproteobacteria bacterium]